MPPSAQKVALSGEGANGPEIRHDRQNPQLLRWKGVRQAAGVENMSSQNSKGQRRIQARTRTNLKSNGDPVGFHSGNLSSGKAV